MGFVPGVTLTKWRSTWAERLRRVPLHVVAVAQADQRRVLDAGEVDLCFVRLPLDTEGLHAIALYEEQPVVWVSRDHPIALFDEVTTADLADERVLADASADSLAAASRDEAVLRVPLSVARSGGRRDLVHRPVTDAPATTIALAWRVDHPNPLVEEFIGIVRGRSATSSRTAQDRAARGKGRRRP